MTNHKAISVFLKTGSFRARWLMTRDQEVIKRVCYTPYSQMADTREKTGA